MMMMMMMMMMISHGADDDSLFSDQNTCLTDCKQQVAEIHDIDRMKNLFLIPHSIHAISWFG